VSDYHVPMLAETGDIDTSTSERILSATAEVLGRNGMTKLSLSEVAQQAGVSRPTLYRWFASKEELLDAFGLWERQAFDNGISAATAGLRGNEKLDAALRFGQMSRVIPVMRERLEKMLPGARGSVAAATAIRVAVAHYIVRSDDEDQFLDQLRHAIGLKPRD
jgi:AcrR family transcriptional regulator